MEMKLLDFHISNLEYACGSSLANVSALNWDQNERLARPLDIQYKSPVKSIRPGSEYFVKELVWTYVMSTPCGHERDKRPLADK